MFYFAVATRAPSPRDRETITTPRAHKIFGGFTKRRQFSNDLDEVDPLESILPGFSRVTLLPNPGPTDRTRGGKDYVRTTP